MMYAEGESERAIRAAIAYQNAGLGKAILIGREAVVHRRIEELGIREAADLEIHNAALAKDREKYIDFLYERLQRQGSLLESRDFRVAGEDPVDQRR